MAAELQPTERRIYVSTACIAKQGLGLWETLRAYRELGLSTVELGSGALAGDLEGDLGARLRAEDLDFLVHNYFPPPAEPFVLNLASPDPVISARSLDQVERSLVLTAELGAPFYSVHGGFVTDPDGFDGHSFVFPAPRSPAEREDATERYVAALGKAVDCAVELGVGLLVENNVCTEKLRDRVLLQTAEEFEALFRALPTPALGMLVDTGHLNVSATTLGFNRDEFLADLADHVQALHVHENDGLADTHRPLSSESWVLELLRAPAFYSCPIIVEAEFASAEAASLHVSRLSEALR